MQSCVKVALDFVSPENIDECVKLTHEFKQLPIGHCAKRDKLEVGCMFSAIRSCIIMLYCIFHVMTEVS